MHLGKAVEDTPHVNARGLLDLERRQHPLGDVGRAVLSTHRDEAGREVAAGLEVDYSRTALARFGEVASYPIHLGLIAFCLATTCDVQTRQARRRPEGCLPS